MGSPLRTRLLLAVLVPAVALFAAFGFVGYRLSRQVLEEELGRSLGRMAALAAAAVNPATLESIQPGDDRVPTRSYGNLLRRLEELRASGGLRRVAVVDEARRAKVDAGGGLPVGAELPELLRDRLEVDRALAGEVGASLVLFEGRDGKTYKSGYAPVRDEASGRVVAVVVVEAEADFFRPLRALGRGFAGLLAVGLLLLGAAAVVTAAGLSAPLRRLMEAALRMGRGDLSTPVPPERTREIGTLAQELESMRVQLEGRDRQLKMMLAGVAHEVRNPLGGMELFAGLLEEELSGAVPSVEEAKGHVTRVRAELRYLTRIVEDFLAFAREQPLSLSTVDGPGLLAAAAAHLAGEAQERGVEVVLEAAPGRVQVDEGLVTAALVNLLKNALQASPPGGKVVLRGRSEAGRYALEVADDGPGIPEAEAARVFEPFFTTREKGTGLGLPLARKIAEAHRGELALQSRPGRTVLGFWLPAAD